LMWLGLSESGFHSDSIPLVESRPVRIRLEFGLHPVWRATTCPNQTRIRTRFGLAGHGLSESGFHSDSIPLDGPRPVRIRLPFGLHPAGRVPACPNQTRIWTPSRWSSPGLSESDSYSDSIPLGEAQLVRISPAFGLHPAGRVSPQPVRFRLTQKRGQLQKKRAGLNRLSLCALAYCIADKVNQHHHACDTEGYREFFHFLILLIRCLLP
jgi:hypothetical protein